MSILSVDTIQPIGSGSTVTLNAAKTVVGTGITFESNGQAIYAGIITATSFSGTASNASGATGDFSIADTIVHSGDTNTKIRFPAADTVTVETAGSERLRITSDGKVGIGTNSPTDILDVYSTTDPTIRSRSGSSSVGANIEVCGGASNDSQLILSSGTTSKYQIFRDGSQSDDLRIYDSTNSLDIIRYRHGGYLHFGVNGAERLRITSSGYVGINQSSPQTGLHINQDWINSYGSISVEGSANALVGLGLRSNGNYRGSLIWRDGSSGNYLDIATYGGAYPILFRPNGTERLRIASNGDIGLGTVPETDSYQPSLYFAGGNANIWGSGNANLYTVVNARYTGGAGWKYNNNGLASYTAQQSGTYEFRNAPSGTADNVATFTTRLQIDSGGRFTALGNKPSANAQMLQNTSSTNPEGLYIRFPNASPNTSARHALKFSDSVGDKAVIDSNGNSRNLNNSYGGFSDISLKENIVDAGSQWDDIKNIKVRVFNFKTDSASDKRIGVVAQEIETVCPKLVGITNDKDVDGNLLETGVKSVKYSVLYMKAIKALQEAQARIETLEAKVTTLEGS